MRIDLTANGQYDYTQPWWNNSTDRVAWERSFQQSERQQQLESSALMLSDPLTPNQVIRDTMVTRSVPPQYGVMTEPPTIDDVLAGSYSSGSLYDRAPTDFSGTSAGVESTSIPSIPYF